MTTNKDTRILPCKHCGSAPAIIPVYLMCGTDYYLKCTADCEAEQLKLQKERADFEAKQKAIIRWNGQQA